MGRPRKPTKLKSIQGTSRKDRANPNEPVPREPLGEPPDSLNDQQKAIWSELAALVPAGVLTGSDRYLMEITSRLLTELRGGEIAVGKLGHLMNCLAKMGLTPADRSKVSAFPDPAKNTDRGFKAL